MLRGRCYGLWVERQGQVEVWHCHAQGVEVERKGHLSPGGSLWALALGLWRGASPSRRLGLLGGVLLLDLLALGQRSRGPGPP